jgi:hypothetical protein
MQSREVRAGSYSKKYSEQQEIQRTARNTANSKKYSEQIGAGNRTDPWFLDVVNWI